MNSLKKIFLLGLLVMVAGFCGVGCKTYKITMSNGQELYSNSRPHLDENGYNYVWKGPNGEQMSLSRMRVRSIEVQ